MGGKGGGGSVPTPPDPVATAEAQGAINRETAVAQARLNRTNEVTPLGSRTYNEFLIPGTEDLYGATATTALNPVPQQAFEADRAARLQAGQLGLQTGQAREAALQAGERFGQQQFLTNEQLRQQEQQSGLSVYQAQEQARQKAAAMGMSAQEIEDRGRQAADQARLKAEQFNIEAQRQRSELGLRGLAADQAGTGQRLEAARMLGGFGDQQQRMDYERLRNLQASGEIQRQLNQQGLSMGYQDFLRQQAYPREQLGFFNQMLRGLPITPGQSTTTYGGPGTIERMLGSGISGVGLYNALNRRT